jgi:hypothetical protein
MLEKLSQKDIRTLKIGAVGVAAILVFVLILEGFEYWDHARKSFQTLDGQLDDIDVDKATQSRLISVVPVFEMPVEKETQKVRLRDKLIEQFRNSRINSQPWLEVAGKTSPLPEYGLLCLKSSGKCGLSQIFDLLARLKQNPYIVGIEELRLKCDAQNPQQIDFDLTVSTFYTKY